MWREMAEAMSCTRFPDRPSKDRNLTGAIEGRLSANKKAEVGTLRHAKMRRNRKLWLSSRSFAA
jgi:hypothetical protein